MFHGNHKIGITVGYKVSKILYRIITLRHL
jgi:hypothetical protein